jgi:NitT/TauT family transport system substrate-binding protein
MKGLIMPNKYFNSISGPDRQAAVKTLIFSAAMAGILLAVIFAAGSLHAQTPSQKAVFVPQWRPQAQFAGYYMAYETGLYTRHGIDLEILDSGFKTSAARMLEEKKADFVTLQLSEAIERRSKGLKLINIGQVSQRSALVIIAKKKNGINSLKDLNGRRLGYWRNDSPGPLQAFLKKNSLSIEIVPITSTVNLFLLDGIDAIVTMWYNEYYRILGSGIDEEELSVFLFFEHSMNLPEDGIYCLEETYARDPQMCHDFVKASLEGWASAFAREEQAIEIVLKYMNRAHITANRPHQRWMLSRMCDIISPAGLKRPIGELDESDYNRVASMLREYKIIETIPDFKNFYMNKAAGDVKK